MNRMHIAAPRIVYVPGVWDQLHYGHLNLLWRARKLADILIVGAVSDAGVKAYKYQLPVESLQLRVMKLRELGFIDMVVYQNSTDPTPQIKQFCPAMLVHGDDWSELLEGNETLKEYGVELVLLPYTKGISSTILRNS